MQLKFLSTTTQSLGLFAVVLGTVPLSSSLFYPVQFSAEATCPTSKIAFGLRCGCLTRCLKCLIGNVRCFTRSSDASKYPCKPVRDLMVLNRQFGLDIPYR